MSIDMEKMRNRMTVLKSASNGGGKFWRPNEGEQTIRIVPPGDGDPFRDFWFHYHIVETPGFFGP